VAIVLLCTVASACSQTAARSPITADQQTKLAELAASPDAPEGLNEALAGMEASEKRRACQDKVAKVANGMQVMGAVGSAVSVAGGMAGSGGKAATKAVAVVQGKIMRARIGQLSACNESADRAAGQPIAPTPP